MTETEICNYSFVKLAGAGDQITGNSFISDINASDGLSKKCKFLYPICRRKVITDLAVVKSPLRETLKYADLGAEIASASLPETGQYEYAFNVPSDCLVIIDQIAESDLGLEDQSKITRYQFTTILNKVGNGKILLTNSLSNYEGTSAFIRYCIDQTNTGTYSAMMVECISTLLAAELAPVAGKNTQIRRELMVEYKGMVIPDTQGFNQSQQDNFTETKTDYLGGR
ncbi:MAG: hypothetical protein PHG53_09535 [Phycisphaerae bacterium]|nr:hypothetical protein [Phycisphaerae bacterium]